MRGLAVAAVLFAVAGPAVADNSPMEQCAVQWRDLTAAGKTAGVDYRTYAATCLKANRQAAAPVVSASAAGQPKRVKASMKAKRPNRMSVCAAQWRQMKAQNSTNGMTYRQWSSKCLSGH